MQTSRTFLLYFLPLALLLGGGSAKLLTDLRAEHETRVLSRLQLAARQTRETYVLSLGRHMAHAAHLARVTALASRQPEVPSPRLLEAFLHDHPAYADITLLDTKGRETFRIRSTNKEILPTRPELLTVRAHKETFRAARDLGRGRVHVGAIEPLPPLDPNVISPADGMAVIPLACPLVATTGERLGVLLLSLRVQTFLAELARDASGAGTPFQFLDGAGEPLYLSDSTAANGQVRGTYQPTAGERRTALPVSDPALWTRIEDAQDGNIGSEEERSEKTLWTFVVLSPALVASSRGGDLTAQEMEHIASSRLIALIELDTARLTPATFTPLVLLSIATLIALALLSRQAARATTQRASLAERLASVSSRAAALADASFDAQILIDNAGNIRAFNHAAQDIFGYSEDEARNLSVDDLLVPHRRDLRDPGESASSIEQLLDQSKRVQEATAQRKSGALFPVERRVHPFSDGGIQLAVIGVRNISERKESESKLMELSTRDGLTGLYNRRHFLYLLEKELVRTRRYGHNLSFFLMETDHFKSVNETFGHGAGDIALKEITRLTMGQLRTVDIFGRMGGTEFGVLLPETNRDGAYEVAERVRRAVEFAAIPSGEEHVNVTVSLGLATLTPAYQGLEAYLRAAETALYTAKLAGRNVVEVAPDAPKGR